MSIFWLGGPNVVIPDNEIKREMYEDRYFKPGIIHGDEDTIIRVYLNDAVGENDPDEFIVEHFTKELIQKAHTADPMHQDLFGEILATEAENFACYNDASGDFATLWAEWPKAAALTNDELAKWAEVADSPVKSEAVPEFIGQIIDTFEDFLEEKGIDIPNDEKDDRDDPDSAAIIYGTDYGNLQSALEELMLNWGVVEKEV